MNAAPSIASTKPAAGVDQPTVDQVAGALCDQILILYEARPLDPQARYDGRVLSFSFEGGLSGADEAMLATGHAEELRIFREAFFESVAVQLCAVVAAIAGAPVAFFSTAFNAGARRTHCYFTLESDPVGADEQRRAIIAWSEQVRHNARELRERHLRVREAHQRLRDLLRDALENSDRD